MEFKGSHLFCGDCDLKMHYVGTEAAEISNPETAEFCIRYVKEYKCPRCGWYIYVSSPEEPQVITDGIMLKFKL